MRNLNTDNPWIAKPENIASYGAVVPLFSSVFSLMLIEKVRPNLNFFQSIPSVFFSIIIVVSIFMLFLPKILKMGWESKYFGISSIYLGSISFFGIVPCFCIFLYGKNSVIVGSSFIIFYLGLIVYWCRRFVMVYKKIFQDSNLIGKIYQEDDDLFYYLQKGDKWVVEKKLNFNQIPHGRYFMISILCAFILFLFPRDVSIFFGLPCIYIFFAVINIPITMMVLGLATRGWLIFYYYPHKIYASSGKRVFVDMTTAPS